MKTILIAGMALSLASLPAAAKQVQINGTTAEGNRTVTVTALTPNIIKVTNTAAGETAPESKTLLTPQFNGTAATVTSLPGAEMLVTPTGVSVRLDKATGEVTIKGGKGRGLYDDGRRDTDTEGRRTLRLLPLDNSETFYGGGERGHALNIAGDSIVMYNRQNYGYTGSDPRIKQMNITMPLLVSPNGYALVMDYYAAAEMLARPAISYASESPAPLTYYFVNAPQGMESLPAELSQIIGRQDLAPFWSLGYITSKYGYKTAHETDSVVNTLKKAGYPLDGIVLDLYWYGIEQDMGRLAWEPSQWGDYRSMLNRLKKKGVNLVAISQPYVLRNGKGIDNYNELSARGMFGKDSVGGTKEVEIWVGEGGMFDVSNPDTRAWLRERYKQLTDSGITGWWGDLGEPERHPLGMYHANGLTTRQYHNLYGNDWSQIIYDLFKEEYPDTRLMTLMRGGTMGLQRYSVFPWSTDVSRSWGGLQPQVTIMLNSGMSGLGYMSHDVGGFAIDEKNPVDPELYVRWLQLGLFSPVLRTHAQQYAEPYLYTDQQDIILPLIKARYEWLPYNYTLAYENATQGMPLVRHIGLYTGNPAEFNNVADQYLWGRDVMVAPVLTQGATSREVVFPEGEWVNINRPAEVYAGGTTAEVAAPLSEIPLFARAGALLPKAGYKMQNTGDYNPADYTVDYYPTANSGNTTFTIFEDDRTSPSSIEKGEFALVKLTADNTPASLKLGVNVEGTYPGIPGRRTVTFVVHNTAKPGKVTAEGAKVKTAYDAKTRTMRITLTSATGSFSATVAR